MTSWPIKFNIKYTEGINIQSKNIRTRFLNRHFDFNVTPLAPPGTKVIINSKPINHPSFPFRYQEAWLIGFKIMMTFVPGGKEGCYIGPSLNHYFCVKCYIFTKRAEVNADTVVFFPETKQFSCGKKWMIFLRKQQRTSLKSSQILQHQQFLSLKLAMKPRMSYSN